MENRIYDKNNGLWYAKQGDYYLPELALPPEEEKPIGIWGGVSECRWHSSCEPTEPVGEKTTFAVSKRA